MKTNSLETDYVYDTNKFINSTVSNMYMKSAHGIYHLSQLLMSLNIKCNKLKYLRHNLPIIQVLALEARNRIITSARRLTS